MSQTVSSDNAVRVIDEARLETDLQYRFEYLVEFIGFSEEDIAAIQASAELLAPVVPALVDAVYKKLFSIDATNTTALTDLVAICLDRRNCGFHNRGDQREGRTWTSKIWKAWKRV